MIENSDRITPPLHRNFVRGLFWVTMVILLIVTLTGCSLAKDLAQDLGNDTGASSSAAPSGTAPAVGPAQAGNYPGALISTVTRVIDGDTLAVAATPELPATNESGDEHVIRLLGIDTPEMNAHSSKKDAGLSPECGARAAADNLADMLLGFKVTVVYDNKSDRTDKYNRSLAYVGLLDPSEASSPGNQFNDANLAQISLGYAEAWYPQGEPAPERYAYYADTSNTAQLHKLGAWGSCDTLGR